MNFRYDGRSHKRGFVLFPLLFLIGGYLIVFLMAMPFLDAFSSASKLLFFDSAQKKKPIGGLFTSAPSSQAKTVKLSEITFPEYGARFGRLTIDTASIRADLYFGDGSEELKKGVGLYNGSFIPGYGKTALIAGHNHTYFHTLGRARVGDKITVETNYGTYLYQITKTQIKAATDKTAYDLGGGKEDLILYTCYPFDCIGLTPDRYYVYADCLSGPRIDRQG